MEDISLEQEAVNENTSSERLYELAQISSELAQLVAQNPCANPELLATLANSSDPFQDSFIRQNLAANPNTPTEILWQLGEEFPQEVLNNPIFSLLLIENPNFVDEIPTYTIVSLVKCNQVPDSFLEKAANRADWNLIVEVVTRYPLKGKMI